MMPSALASRTMLQASLQFVVRLICADKGVLIGCI
jgi:hypothetical protein